MENEFSLIPFGGPVSGVKDVSGTISLENGVFAVAYRVTADIESLVMDAPATVPVRRDGLWKGSCFEFFVQGVGRDAYHEVNLSPSGDWNVYRFTGYRGGMMEESALDSLESTLVLEGEGATVRCHVPFGGWCKLTSAMRVGISCILLHRTGTQSYWALSHPGPKPDFHDSRAFHIRL